MLPPLFENPMIAVRVVFDIEPSAYPTGVVLGIVPFLSVLRECYDFFLFETPNLNPEHLPDARIENPLPTPRRARRCWCCYFATILRHLLDQLGWTVSEWLSSPLMSLQFPFIPLARLSN